jgi:hypothetical protein
MWIRKRRAASRQWSTGIRNTSNPRYLNKAVIHGGGQTAWDGEEGRSIQRQNRQRKNDMQKGRYQGEPRPPPPALPLPTPPPSMSTGVSLCKSLHNLLFAPNILLGRLTPIEPTEFLISKLDIHCYSLEESPLPPPPVPGPFPPPPNSPLTPLRKTVVKQFQFEDSDDGSNHVAADYSAASHSTVWNMFLYVDLAEHRMHRDNVS